MTHKDGLFRLTASAARPSVEAYVQPGDRSQVQGVR